MKKKKKPIRRKPSKKPTKKPSRKLLKRPKPPGPLEDASDHNDFPPAS